MESMVVVYINGVHGLCHPNHSDHPSDHPISISPLEHSTRSRMQQKLATASRSSRIQQKLATASRNIGTLREPPRHAAARPQRQAARGADLRAADHGASQPTAMFCSNFDKTPRLASLRRLNLGLARAEDEVVSAWLRICIMLADM